MGISKGEVRTTKAVVENVDNYETGLGQSHIYQVCRLRLTNAFFKLHAYYSGQG
jgi:hypothetical protein